MTMKKLLLPARELKIGDYYGGDKVVEIVPDPLFIVFYTEGKPYPQGYHADFQIYFERDM